MKMNINDGLFSSTTGGHSTKQAKWYGIRRPKTISKFRVLHSMMQNNTDRMWKQFFLTLHEDPSGIFVQFV